MSEPLHDHDRGLAYDLQEIERRLIGRRKALGLLATGGAVVLVGCGGGSEGQTSTGTISATPTPTPTLTPSATPTPSPSPSPSGACVADASETNGPYPADGTNTSSGSTSNVLTVSGVIRSDIRSSFLNGSTTAAPGVPLTITLTVVDVNAGCTPLAGYAVYLWHCDREGRYSLYDVPAESWLRGMQVTDANGRLTFTTIFPGCYAGRYPHMHFEVFSSTANALSGRYARLISQLAMPADACTSVYSGGSGYSTSLTRFRQTSVSGDNVFGDNSSAQIAAMTPTFTGDVTNGITMAATVGIAT